MPGVVRTNIDTASDQPMICADTRSLRAPASSCRQAASVVMGLVFAVGMLCLAQPAWPQPVRIMPFGDAETIGSFGKVGYRYPLWFQLQDAGFAVDFVGSVTGTAGDIDSDWYPEYYSTFDRDHQGAFFEQTDALVPIARSAAASFRPDVILLMAGMADVWFGGSGGVLNVKFKLPEIISEFRASVPNVTILLSQVPPYVLYAGYPEESENRKYIEPLNEEIANIANELDSAESPIYLIDNHTGFDSDTMFCCRDQMLPDPDGEAWIANNFFQALETVLPDLEAEGFAINQGLSDAWYNEGTNGQGFFITVLEDSGLVFLAWFTYDVERPPGDAGAILGEPGHRWLTAQGPYQGDTAELKVYVSSGGVFDSAEPAVGPPVEEGAMTIQWHDCSSATLSYDLNTAGQGVIPLTRVAPDNEPLCEALSSP